MVYATVTFTVSSMIDLLTWLEGLAVRSWRWVRTIDCGSSMYRIDRPFRYARPYRETPAEIATLERQQLHFFGQWLAKEGIVLRRGVLKAPRLES